MVREFNIRVGTLAARYEEPKPTAPCYDLTEAMVVNFTVKNRQEIEDALAAGELGPAPHYDLSDAMVVNFGVYSSKEEMEAARAKKEAARKKSK